MCSKATLLRKWLHTGVALVWFVTSVRLHVLHEPGLIVQRLHTHMAPVRSVTIGWVRVRFGVRVGMRFRFRTRARVTDCVSIRIRVSIEDRVRVRVRVRI
jgi:hypothetical protein